MIYEEPKLWVIAFQSRDILCNSGDSIFEDEWSDENADPEDWV